MESRRFGVKAFPGRISSGLPLDRRKNVSYPVQEMKVFQFPRIIYIVLVIYEFLKILVLSSGIFADWNAIPDIPGLFGYMSLPALCLVPVMFFMLAGNEKAFMFCLPLVLIVKGLSVLSFGFLAVRSLRVVFLYPPQFSDFSKAFYVILMCVPGDLATFFYCLGRRKNICG